MIYENYIFTGFGFSAGKYKITNADISDAIDKEFLQGFSKEKVSKNKKYIEYLAENPGTTPLDYFAGHIMGFYERHHVTPFPPTTKKLYYSETSLDLCIKSTAEALKDSCLQASEIDAWFVSTVSPHEQAPGIASTLKSYFVPFSNYTPAFSLSSGCAGFNMNLERAVEFLQTHQDAKHVLIAHTELMSSFLTQRVKFVPFVTFGDASAAIVLSKLEDESKYGVIKVVNLHDLNMLDYVGVDGKRNLYMNDSLIKDRATINLPDAAEKVLNLSNWHIDEVDIMVPHQTGNVILIPAAEKIGIPVEKVFFDAQQKYGNVSGATIPLSLALLNQDQRLKDNFKILSATAGVGGNFGAFTYIHKHIPKENCNFDFHSNELKGKNVLILGASGEIGYAVATELKKRGASLFLHTFNRLTKLETLQPVQIYNADFLEDKSLNDFIQKLKDSAVIFDYFINLSGTIDENNSMQINYYAPIKIINAILPQIKETILNIGTAAEDLDLADSKNWVSSNRAFHGYLSSASGEFAKNGIRTVYLQIGFGEFGISEKLSEKYLFKFMLSSGQVVRLKTCEISNSIANSLYLPKVLHIHYAYENAMLIGRMGYRLDVDI